MAELNYKDFKSRLNTVIERMKREGKLEGSMADFDSWMGAISKLDKKYKIRYTAQEKIKKVDKPRVLRYLFK